MLGNKSIIAKQQHYMSTALSNYKAEMLLLINQILIIIIVNSIIRCWLGNDWAKHKWKQGHKQVPTTQYPLGFQGSRKHKEEGMWKFPPSNY